MQPRREADSDRTRLVVLKNGTGYGMGPGSRTPAGGSGVEDRSRVWNGTRVGWGICLLALPVPTAQGVCGVVRWRIEHVHGKPHNKIIISL
jgi:hypothetical protein